MRGLCFLLLSLATLSASAFEFVRDGTLVAKPVGGESAAEKLSDGAPGPGERFESSATAADVRAAIAALPEGPRQVVLMRIEAEMSFKEIAATMGIPLGTALTWMHVATVTLKKSLGGAR